VSSFVRFTGVLWDGPTAIIVTFVLLVAKAKSGAELEPLPYSDVSSETGSCPDTK
jgi:hypothetical protein